MRRPQEPIASHGAPRVCRRRSSGGVSRCSGNDAVAATIVPRAPRSLCLALLLLLALVPAVHAQEDLDFLFDDGQVQDRGEGEETRSGSEANAEAESGSENSDNAEPKSEQKQEAAAPQSASEGGLSSSVDEEVQDTDRGRGRRGDGRVIEEIVVTAQKREQSLSDVPISVQAFDSGDLAAANVLDLGDLPKLSPGVTVTTQVSYVSTYIRGVGSDAFLLADPSVAYYVDGIYYPFASGAVQDFGSVERVEVLKGPQGTLFGRNAIGGAVNVVTQDANPEAQSLSLQSITGRFDRPKARFRGNVPITDDLALSTSVFYNSSENHIEGRDAVSPSNPEGDALPRERSQGGRFKLHWSPASWMKLDAGLSRVKQTGTGTQYAPNVEPSLIAQLLGVEAQDGRAGAVNEQVGYSRRSNTVQLEMAFDARLFELKLLGSNQLIHNRGNYDFDGSPQALADFDVQPTFADVQTAELQLLSKPGGIGGERFEWIAGAYYFRSDQGFDPAFLTLATTDLEEAGTVLGIPLPDTLREALDPALTGAPVPGGRFQFRGIVGTESIAYFGQVTADVAPWLALTLGARFQQEERVLIESSSAIRNTDGSVRQLQSFSGEEEPRFRDTTTSFDPKVSLDFRPGGSWLGQDPLVYLSWQTATKSSTFNAVNITDEPEFVRPEEIRALELGLKTALLDGLMRLDAALFDYRIDDLQVQFISLLEGGAVTFENAASAGIRGADFNLSTALFPGWLEGLTLTAGGAFLDAEYLSYPNGSGFDPQTGLLTRNNDFTGNRVVRTPEFSGNAGLQKRWPLAGSEVVLGIDYYYNSGFFYLAQNTPNVEEDAYGTLGARIGYHHEGLGLRVTLFGSNLTDTDYNLSRFPTDFGVNDARARGISGGLRINLAL